MKFFKTKKDSNLNIKKSWKIKRSCLNLILECAKSSYPNEFGGLLRVDKDLKDVVSELVVLPGTISGDSHAIFKLHMLPIDLTIIGTVHSHPSFSPNPSDADIDLFRKHGKVHIIAANPYSETSWKAYDHKGNTIEMKII
jgi:proteasome lid subunit RPN8/RPN11